MAKNTSQYPDRVYMAEISAELGKDRSTIVTWEARGWLPEGLEFQRDEDNNWRYWTREQLERARAWINRPGKRRMPKRFNAA